ncbi:MAG: AtpZ/AtpI family protein [Devosia sp.]
MSEPRDDNRPDFDSATGKAAAEIEARIARARGQRSAEAATEQTRQGDMSGLSRGLRLGSEFVAAIVIGAGLGYIIDMVLPTRPWGMVVLLLLGFAAGVLNVVRATRDMNNATAVPPTTPALPDDDDD